MPTKDSQLAALLQLITLTKNTKVVDLGSGDGKLVIALTQKGAQVTGYEINPLLVQRARQKLAELQLAHQATIKHQDFWHADLSRYQVVVVYGVERIMKRLQTKIAQEVRPGTQVVSVDYQFPEWESTATLNQVYLYQF